MYYKNPAIIILISTIIAYSFYLCTAPQNRLQNLGDFLLKRATQIAACLASQIDYVSGR